MDVGLLYRRHVADVHAFALRRVGDPDVAWDVVSETFVVAWRHRAKQPADGQQQLAWLYAIAGNVVRNVRRSDRRLARLRMRLDAQPRSDQDPEQEVSGGRAARVVEALERLGPRDRQILQLIAWEDLDMTGVAAVLGISPGTARVRLHRARQRLLAALEELETMTEQERHP